MMIHPLLNSYWIAPSPPKMFFPLSLTIPYHSCLTTGRHRLSTPTSPGSDTRELTMLRRQRDDEGYEYNAIHNNEQNK